MNPADDGTRYRVYRWYKNAGQPSKTILEGLTLAEAQRHCRDPKSKGTDPRKGDWMDCYTRQ